MPHESALSAAAGEPSESAKPATAAAEEDSRASASSAAVAKPSLLKTLGSGETVMAGRAEVKAGMVALSLEDEGVIAAASAMKGNV